MNHQVLNPIFFATVISFGLLLQACNSADVGGNGDKTKPVVTLSGIVDANNADNEIIGDATIQWVADEPNRSTVDIYLSADSGTTFTLLANDAPDIGEYAFDTNDIDDCRYCRLRIIAKDIVGNESNPVDSTEDFIINNVPQVLGVALYVDPDSNGADPGDTIIVPFDKNIETRTGIASDIFILPVLGDSIGPYATLGKGARPNELVITMNDYVFATGHLHIKQDFDPDRLGRTAASGLNVHDNLSSGILYARDTGRTAAFVEGGIDIIAGFADSGVLVGTDYSPSVTLADVNNDGDLDMVQGYYPARLFTYAGGVFTDSNQVLGNSYAVAFGNLNSGSFQDMVQGSYGSGTQVRLNNGAGDFTALSQTLCVPDLNGYCPYTNAVAIGDVDGDGDQDIVEGNSGAANQIWLNNGAGSFSVSAQSLCVPDQYGNCPYTYSVALGDVDNDTDLDMIVGYSGRANQLWLNDGAGVFTASTQSLSYCDYSDPITQQCNQYADTREVVLRDVNGDGYPDLLVAGGAYTAGHARANRLWMNNGAGVFTDSGQSFGGIYIESITVADVDDDGDVDLAQGVYEGTRVWRNNGLGRFSESGQFLAGTAYSLAIGDVDGDSDVDVVAGGYGARISLNSQNRPASYFIDSEQSIPDSDTRSVALGDVDGDGDLDKVEGSSGQGSRVFLNNISEVAINRGVYTDSGQVLCSDYLFGSCATSESIVLGDVDGDGDLDIVDGNGAGNRVWLNDGAGTFADSGQRLSGCSFDDTNTVGCDNYYYTYSVVLGDVDGDADLDMVAPAASGSGVQVWKNNGAGVFSSFDVALGNSNTESVVLGDVDGDTDLDLVVGSNGAGSQVWKNDGTGVFSSFGAALGSSYTNSIALSNVDGDADLDLVVGSYGAGSQVWLNNGTGTFTSFGSAFGGTTYVYAIALGDVDGDDDLDMVTGNDYQANSQVNVLWLNNGSGVFTDSGQRLCRSPNTNAPAGCNSYTYTITLGDVDDDGDLDVVQGGYQANEVWLNDF